MEAETAAIPANAGMQGLLRLAVACTCISYSIHSTMLLSKVPTAWT